eukprot:GCRY01002082.1.p1 GENE.GCRY01002082.1~~GCRY01002082.1.p1  ORF type:complete len:172 (-),score=17.97 GCRY01002082.1:86-601(-)
MDRTITLHRFVKLNPTFILFIIMATKSIVIGADHGAFELKMVLVEYLKEKGIQVLDVGTFDGSRVDYPDIAASVCAKIVSGEFEKGIVCCGTGIGISIAANKIDGIRCALCHDHYTAKMCREHNNANVLALGGRVTGDEVAKDIVDVYLSTEFLGGRHATRVEKIMKLQEQ